MKKFIIAVAALVSVCAVSCKKETVSPEKASISNVYMSGGGDKRPSSHCD